jgi:hypothetical protein
VSGCSPRGGWDWVHSVLQPLTGLLYQPQTIYDECGAVSGMRVGRGNWSTLIKPALLPLCPPKIPHYLTWARTWAAVVGSQQLTARAMARLLIGVFYPQGKSGWGVKLTTHLYLVPRSRMMEPYPFSHMSSWRDA